MAGAVECAAVRLRRAPVIEVSRRSGTAFFCSEHRDMAGKAFASPEGLFCSALEAGVHRPSVTFNGLDTLAHLISLNLRRRHLKESQHATVAAKIAKLDWGVRTDRAANLPLLEDIGRREPNSDARISHPKAKALLTSASANSRR